MLYCLANSSCRDHFLSRERGRIRSDHHIASRVPSTNYDHHEPNIKTLYSFSTGASIEWRLFQSISLNWMLAPIQPRERMNTDFVRARTQSDKRNNHFFTSHVFESNVPSRIEGG